MQKDNVQITKQLLDQFFGFFGVAPQIDITQNAEDLSVVVNGGDMSYLIGYRGQSLDALSDLVSHVVFNQTGAWANLVLDVNGYNLQRVERLHNLAKRFIDRVRFFQQEVEMPPLNAWERKQIHMYIKDYDDVETESRGDGKMRKLYLRSTKKS